MPPQPVQTRWNSWLETVQYHQEHMHLYRGFLEEEDSDAQSVARICNILTGDSYAKLRLQVSFIADSCDRLMTALTTLETTKEPIATRVYDILEDLESILRGGCNKVLFGETTDALLRPLRRAARDEYLESFHNVYMRPIQVIKALGPASMQEHIQVCASVRSPQGARTHKELGCLCRRAGY